MAPLRAVLNWAPVQAMAAMQPISFVYITEKQASAACIQDWDSWRDSGVCADIVDQGSFLSSLKRLADLWILNVPFLLGES